MKIQLRHTRDEKVMNSAKNSTNQHAIFTSDAFEMENTIRMQTHPRSCSRFSEHPPVNISS